MSKSR